LIKDQGVTTITDPANPAYGSKLATSDSKANGIYVVVDKGSPTSNWILQRSGDANQVSEIRAGLFTFVQEGDVWGNAGFILILSNGSLSPIVLNSNTVTGYMTYTQFSSAGKTLAGDGLVKIGDNINIVGATNGGITVNADSIEISSTISGEALTFTRGVLDVGYDNVSIGYTGSSTKKLQIKSDWVGQGSINTLAYAGYLGSAGAGITTGTWKADTIAVPYGGTGLSAVAAGDIIYGSDVNTLSTRSSTSSDKYKFLMVGSDQMPMWSDIDGGVY
jgi:hypothetical protein